MEIFWTIGSVDQLEKVKGGIAQAETALVMLMISSTAFVLM